MIAIIIGLIVGYLFGRSMSSDMTRYSEPTRGDRIFNVFFILLFSVMGVLMASLFISLIAMLFVPTESKEVGRSDIVALKDKSETSGQFFLGTGSIEGELVYYAIVQTDNGLQTQQFGISETKLFEGNHKPHVKTINKVFTGKACLLLGCMNMGDAEYHFYLPAESIDRNIRVDLEG